MAEVEVRFARDMLERRKKSNGYYEYEIEPGRWVSHQRLSQLKNRTADRARIQVWQALNQGTLRRGSCRTCGQPNAEAHHYNYDDPFAIVWLCKKHHDELGREHRKNRPIEIKSSMKRGRPKGKWKSPEKRVAENIQKFVVAI